MELKDLLTVGLSVVSAIIAVVAIARTSRNAADQRRLSTELNEKQQRFTTDLNEKQQRFTAELNKEQQRFTTELNTEQQRLTERLNREEASAEKRKFFVTLWDKMVAVNQIDPVRPIGPDVTNAVDTLELVSLCWQADIVDKRMVVVAFGMLFLQLHGQIQAVAAVPGLGTSGRDLLLRAQAIGVVYKQIEAELQAGGRL